MSQERLAELAGISYKYVGVLERSEKSPSLETLINIANALNISTDKLLCDILNTEIDIKQTVVSERINGLSRKEQRNIIDLLEMLVSQAEQR
jgi:transcriptional regulator with XRE-family HTH domain